MQPVGGEGDKVFPATYGGDVYARERRAFDGRIVDCVLIDSVQAQSNRAEEALKTAIERGRIKLPLIEVCFQEANEQFRTPLPELTSLDVPHRLADAILRDSVLPDGARFSKSDYARRWGRANRSATPDGRHRALSCTAGAHWAGSKFQGELSSGAHHIN